MNKKEIKQLLERMIAQAEDANRIKKNKKINNRK